MRYLNIIIFLFVSNFALAQKEQLTQNVRGIVTEQISGKKLTEVTIALENKWLKTSTDREGKFYLRDVPLGRYTLYAHSINHETFVLKDVLVGSAKEVFLEIELLETSTILEEILITSKANKENSLNKMSLLGSQMFKVEEASRFAGGMDDPARLVSNYAGVTTSGTTNNGISIRGNAPGLLQWKLEDVEIPNPNHFADISVLGGGLLSALSANVLANSDFFIGAFPAEYSNAVSGVFDMRLRNGNNERYQHTFQLGLLGIDFASEGPVNKQNNSSYIINYRYSTTGLLAKLQRNKDMGGTLGYQDLNFKLNLPTQKAGTFSLWGTGLIDEVIPTINDKTEQKYLDDGILSSANQKSGAVGLSHRYFFKNSKTSVKTTVATTHSGNHLQEEFDDLNQNRSPKTDMNANITNFVFTSAMMHKFDSIHSNKTGVTFTNINYDMNLDYTPYFGQPLENFNYSKGSTNLLAAYSQSLINVRDNLTLSIGLNVQHLSLNGKTSIEPRAALKWHTNDQNSLALGYGLHSRMEKADVYFVKDVNGNLANKNLNFTKSHHFMLIYMRKISDNMNLKVEPYFQSLYDVPVSETGSYSILNRNDFYITQSLVSEGKGKNYGVDITFSKYLTNGMYYMLTTSLFQSRYQSADGDWFDTRYNRRFVANGLIGKEWMLDRNMLSVNLKLTTMGGQRYTPVDKAATLAHPDKEVQYDESRQFSEQFSPMFIGDFSISYKMNRRKTAHTFALKSVNATRQKEYLKHKYNIITGNIEPVYSTNSLFNVSYKIDF
ncbi:TonB-dependent receptor [Sphingobacterium spiritivorum]|uniref:TonB-dependent receptor n=1 Tax=Sphingobacterium spiritivorum TaxID=258 RepID=UPI003DA56D08